MHPAPADSAWRADPGDFASAAMLRVLQAGLQQLDGAAAAARPAAAAHAGKATPPLARVPLGDKRALLAEAIQRHGFAGLPQLGAGIAALRDDPTGQALLSARDPQDLLQRWMRLERYIHSRHRCRVQVLGETGVEVHHLPRRSPEAPPLPAEDLVVAGVLAALLAAIGTRGLIVVLPARPDVSLWPVTDAIGLQRVLGQPGGTACWQMRWREQVEPLPAPGRRPGGADNGAAVAPLTVSGQVAALLAADLSSATTLGRLAGALGSTPRTLQRRLAEEGATLQSLKRQARLQQAAAWLRQSGPRAPPVAGVGYLCGYADQPHFTREFHAAVGLTPAAYRQAFADRAAEAAATGASPVTS